ncbi:hypothetical protein [Paraburkholderia sp. BL10I2N1]|uniref:hypothetical protein n=1 Tax=Paraburkholderia sp. BL10I2N1 TaxID=1938796 RepID=UPI00105C82B8|nr:hypothetical protein [Paraburkholderia sp. BL10I2N1]
MDGSLVDKVLRNTHRNSFSVPTNDMRSRGAVKITARFRTILTVSCFLVRFRQLARPPSGQVVGVVVERQ